MRITGNQVFKNISSVNRFNLVLWGIILAGAVFRFRDLGSQSLTADEASALLRLQFPDFSSMMHNGVLPDGHPAFAQLLLWFWTKCFGISEFAIRFPFALMGTASVFLAAQIAKRLFSDTACLCVAACMAFLQFPLMYSQLARPYAPGLFFVLVSFFVLLGFFEEKKVSWKITLSLSLSLSLCAYSHYFAMLEAGLIALLGIYFVKKANRKMLFISFGIAVLLFLPYTGYFIHQLKTGGVGGPGGWLGVPKLDFIDQHLFFIFNSSVGIEVALLLLFVGSLLVFRKRTKKMHLALFLLWFFPLLAGFIYSVKVNPVLQDSVLLFGFPFLLIFIFGWLPGLEWHKEITKQGTFALIVPAILSLMLVYYAGTYKPYSLTDHFGRLKELVYNTIDWQDAHNNYKTDVFYNVDAPYFVNYYYDKPFDFKFRKGIKRKDVLGDINNGDKELLAFRKLVENSKADYFIYAWSTKEHPLEIPEIIRGYFPYLVKKEEWFNSAWYVFGRTASLDYIHQNEEILFSQTEDFMTRHSGSIGWSQPCRIFCAENVSLDSTTKEAWYSKSCYTRVDSTCVYGPMLKIKLRDLVRNPDNQLLLDADLLITKQANATLVIEVHRGDSLLCWNGRDSRTQLSDADTSTYHHVYFGWPLPADLNLSDEAWFYIYSQNGKRIFVRSLTARAMRGHVGIYGVRPDFQ